MLAYISVKEDRDQGVYHGHLEQEIDQPHQK